MPSIAHFHFTRKTAANQGEDPNAVKPANRYAWIAFLMMFAAVFIGWWPAPFGDHATIWLEASMIALFAVFWVIQTQELWDLGLRAPSA